MKGECQMTLKEPNVEFVKIDTAVQTYTASQTCPAEEAYKGGTPSMEMCEGPDAPGNNCNKYGFVVMM